jgi:glycosyltransferase-like protein
MLTYSVKPRGGVVHALEVSEALARRGHDVELVALARPGEELFRRPRVPLRIVRYTPPDVDFDARIAAMMDAYSEGMRSILPGFDVIHSQDCLSANAALALRDEGVIERLIRTVHHVDDFTSPSLVFCQDRSIMAPDHVLCVSEPWVERLWREFGVSAGLVPNGVDARRFRAPRDAAERAAARAGLEGYVVLTVGGIEPRKGSLTLLEAFARMRSDAVLLIAGGATLFDYRHERARFDERARELGVTERVHVLGALAAEEIERLYRAADVFAFPSVKEGFGLVALEALASGLPVVASDLDVFAHLRDSALLVPVGDVEALAAALERPRPPARDVVARFTWDASAEAHEQVYELLGSLAR